MATLGFLRRDFEVFAIDGFNARIAKIYEHVRPRLIKLGNEIAPELSRNLHMEFFAHVPKHVRRAANPPDETWTAFGPSRAGYKRYGYLALCVSKVGIHTRAVVNADADNRAAIGRLIMSKASDLEKSFRGTKIQDYRAWDCHELPRSCAASADFFEGLGDALETKVWQHRRRFRMARARRPDRRSSGSTRRISRARTSVPHSPLCGVKAKSGPL